MMFGENSSSKQENLQLPTLPGGAQQRDSGLGVSVIAADVHHRKVLI